jgi:hypothetical protein
MPAGALSRVLGVKPVLPQHLAAVDAVLEAVGDRRDVQPIEVRLVGLVRTVIGDDEEVEIGVLVETAQVGADRAEPEQRDHVAAVAEHAAKGVEPREQPLGYVRHGRGRYILGL